MDLGEGEGLGVKVQDMEIGIESREESRIKSPDKKQDKKMLFETGY